jgi:CRP-like cAMP-binding protein
VIRGSGIGNRLLAALPPADFDLLALSLETVALDQATVLSRAGDRIEHVLLPHSGAISLTAVTAIVRAAGTASRIAACRFHAAFNRSPAIRHAVQINIRAMLIQLQLGAACNALHPVKARMARLLLDLRDHVDNDVVPLTQEDLSQILGVRRATVLDQPRRRRLYP